jgi:hypothetical protein
MANGSRSTIRQLSAGYSQVSASSGVLKVDSAWPTRHFRSLARKRCAEVLLGSAVPERINVTATFGSNDLRPPVEQSCIEGARPHMIGGVKLQVHDRPGRCLVGAHVSVGPVRIQQPSRSPHSSLALVLVVPADPELPRLALVAALRRAVEHRVVAHEDLPNPRHVVEYVWWTAPSSRTNVLKPGLSVR